MSDGVTWTGVDQLMAALTALPRDLAKLSEPIVLAAANDAATKIKAAYPRKSGALIDGVKVINQSTELKAKAKLTSTAIHAGMYEYGIGLTPAGKVFIPTAIVARRDAARQVAEVIEQQGATVTAER